MHYETRALFSSTKSWIYDKEKFEQVKVILFYKSVMESNSFLFDPTVRKYIIVELSMLKLRLRMYK